MELKLRMFSILLWLLGSVLLAAWLEQITWLRVHIVWWIWRYLRLIVHCFSHWLYQSVPIPEKPRYTAADVTLVIPTIHYALEELRPSLESIIACRPHEILLVTTNDKRAALEKLVASLSSTNIRVFSVGIANKRRQVCRALPEVKTAITVMADDDVTWPITLLPWILAPFENPKIGGVGTNQRVRREPGAPWSAQMWNWLGAAYIERRNFEISATHGIDGGTSCMSGRTGAYRSEILQSPLFMHDFQHEQWLDKYDLNADDDNFLTRWLVNNQWETWVQYDEECEVETTLENGVKYLYQCARWARSNWRSNYTSMREGYIWRQQAWCSYALHLTMFTNWAFVSDLLIFWTLWQGTRAFCFETRLYLVIAELLWTFVFSKTVKLAGLFRRNPRDVVFIPLSIIFGYVHGLIKLYAGLTINVTSWGSRPDGDADDSQRMSPRAQLSPDLMTPKKRPDDLEIILKSRAAESGRLGSGKEPSALQQPLVEVH